MGRELRAYPLVLLGIVFGLTWGGACSSSGSSSAAPVQQAGAWEKIESITLASDAPIVEFNSIPSGYRVLKLLCLNRTSSNSAVVINFNDDFGSNYTETDVFDDGNQGLTATGPLNNPYLALVQQQGSTTGNFSEAIISNDPTREKSLLVHAEGGVTQAMIAGRWSNATDEINKITIPVLFAPTLSAGSTYILPGMSWETIPRIQVEPGSRLPRRFRRIFPRERERGIQ